MDPMITTIETLLAATEDKSLTVWGYCRVSTDKQDEGYSPEAQQQAVIAYAEEHKLKSIKVVFEVGSAGKPMLPVAMPGGPKVSEKLNTTNPRPLFAALVNHLCRIKNAHLIIWKLDRFSRLSYEQEIFLELLNRSNVRIHSTQAAEDNILSGDGVDPQRAFFRQIMGAVAQYERAVIATRMKMGARIKASKGGWVGGTVPFGYEVKDGDLAIKQDHAHIVRLIFYLREQLDYTMLLIAEHLNATYPSVVDADHTPTQEKRKRKKTAARHASWHKMRISRVVNSRNLYMGNYEDPYGGVSARPDLRILPDSLSDWYQSVDIEVSEAEPSFKET